MTQLFSRTITAAAIADHSVRAALTTYADGKTSDNGIKIGGKMGSVFTLVAIEIVLKGVLTTVVNAGGLFEFSNNAVDWLPLEFYPNLITAVGANAGAAMTKCRIPVNVPLPAGSITSIYYTALNAAIDRPYVTLYWTEQGFGGKQTFSDAAIGTAITQVTIAQNHVSIPIPVAKGGRIKAFATQVYGVIETIVVSGGFVQVHNTSVKPGLEPCQFETGGVTSVGTGGAELPLEMHPQDCEAPAGSSFDFDYTPTDNQSQQLAVMVIWEK
jgi:hypothetical protein